MRRWLLQSCGFLLALVVFCVYVFLPRQSVAAVVSPHAFETLVIDPGHGGDDGGAVSVAGRKESDLNLSVSLRTRDLATLLGIPCVMTREDDRSLHTVSGSIARCKASDLQNRVNFVNSVSNALFISIHQNHFPQEKYHGAQVFYAQTDGSEDLAKRMQQVLRSSLDTTNHRSVKACRDVYVMEHVRCPAVLVECGFLSNVDEEEKLHRPEYQKKIAAAILSAVVEYKSEANGIDKI